MKTHYLFAAIMFLVADAPVFSRELTPFHSQEGQDENPNLKISDEVRRAEINDEIQTPPESPKCRPLIIKPNAEATHQRTNPDCLAAYYDFTDFEPATGDVRDKSGNGFNLSAVNFKLPDANLPASATDGIAGKGLLMNGGYFQARGNPLAGADHFTISVWFKTAEPMNNYKLLSAAVWHGGNNATGWNVGTHYSEFWADNQEGSLRGEPDWKRNTEFRKNAWNHLVLTYDGAHVREYINGELSVNIRGSGLKVGDGAPMVVGAWMGRFQFRGVLDELRIYRRALKETEVQALHSEPTGSPTSTAMASKPIPENDAPLRLAVDMSDGSHLIGVPDAGSFILVTPYAKMKIQFKEGTVMRLNDDHETVIVEMENGDRLKGSLRMEALKLKTIFGEVSVDMNRIRSLKVLAPETVSAKG